jgi:hypothetical protein
MVIFHSYVSLPEGNLHMFPGSFWLITSITSAASLPTWNVGLAASEDVRDHEGERHQRNERGSASGDFLHHWGVKNGEH